MIEGPQPNGLQSLRWFAGAVQGSLPHHQSRQSHLENRSNNFQEVGRLTLPTVRVNLRWI